MDLKTIYKASQCCDENDIETAIAQTIESINELGADLSCKSKKVRSYYLRLNSLLKKRKKMFSSAVG
jgi:hypothetical protein